MAKNFSEDIRKLSIGRSISKSYPLSLNFITDKVVSNFDVFGPLIKKWIGRNMKRSLIITV